MEGKEHLQQMAEAYRNIRVPKQEQALLYEVIQKAKKDAAKKRRQRNVCYISSGIVAAAAVLILLPGFLSADKGTKMSVAEDTEEVFCAAELEDSFYLETDIAEACMLAENEAAKQAAEERYGTLISAAAKEGADSQDMEEELTEEEDVDTEEAGLKEMFQEYNRRRPRIFVQGADKSE